MPPGVLLLQAPCIGASLWPVQRCRSCCCAPAAAAPRRYQRSGSGAAAGGDAAAATTAAAAPPAASTARRRRRRLVAAASSAGDDAAAAASGPSSPSDLAARIARVRALDEYTELMQRSGGDGADDDAFPLLRAALLIARHRHPLLDEEAVRHQLASLANEVEARLAEAGVTGERRYPLRVARAVSQVLFEDYGFKGDADDYYDADNSCVDRVLARRKGIPITLSLVWAEVARRVGLPTRGVNLPAHFMLRLDAEGAEEVLVDAFNGGELVALEDAARVIERVTGAANVTLDRRYLREPPSARAVLLRMLQNLRQIYRALNKAEDALAVVRYMQATIPPGAAMPELLRDMGVCLLGLGRLQESAAALAQYLAAEPGAPDAAVIAGLLTRVRERLAAAAAATAAAEAAGRGVEEAQEERGEAGEVAADATGDVEAAGGASPALPRPPPGAGEQGGGQQRQREEDGGGGGGGGAVSGE